MSACYPRAMPPHTPTPTPAPSAAVSLSVSVVVFHPDRDWLETTLSTLAESLLSARTAGILDRVNVAVVDNGASSVGSAWAAMLDGHFARHAAWVDARVLAGQGNIGYGAANNLAFAQTPHADYLLVLNPDVRLDRSAIAGGIAYLTLDAGCGMVTPVAEAPDGTPLFLVKSYPHVWVLAARGFAPEWLRSLLRRRLDQYERADRPHDSPLADVQLASGCFLLIRGGVFRRVGGFDPAFFLYFEDFDLSFRICKAAAIARVPECRIVHAGGGAARKGFAHTRMFVRSAWRFFNKHGWCW